MKLSLWFSALLILFSNVSIPTYADEYTIQIGDIVRVSLPGETQLDKNFDIDRQGHIILPEVGNIDVVGLTEAEMSTKIQNVLSRAFKDLSSLRVYVHQRQVLINVLGYVEKPGEITLLASANIQTAFQKAGGLRAGAQLDKMQIRRKDETIFFNYKEYLDSGNESLLPKLQSLDVIFIPASPMTGNVEVAFDPSKMADSGDAADSKDAIKLFGEVNSPGSFSYKEEATLVDLIMKAGGVTRYANVDKIRVISNGAPKLFSLKAYLDTGNDKLLPKIEPGSTIFVPIQEEEVKAGGNTVYVMGEVQKPGAYENQPAANFMDILANAGGPTRYADSRQIKIIKSNNNIISFDLSAYTEGRLIGGIPNIVSGDAIFIPEKTDVNEKSWLKVAPTRAVGVIGQVFRPGRVEWSDEMSLMDLLAHVGGPTSKADTARIEVLTPDSNGNNKITLFNLDRYINKGQNPGELPTIKAGSTIRINELPTDPSDNKSQWVRQSSEVSIYVFGQVGAPGRYAFTEELNFLDILSAADGPTKDADLHNIRINHRDKKFANVTKLNLSLYFETGDDNLLPKVLPGDTIYIPAKDRTWIDEPQEKTVRILGAINKPGRYRFSDDMTILDLLAEAGGTKDGAYLEKITVVNLSCCEDQSTTFNLSEFSKTADFSMLPVVRNGDTIFIPSGDERPWKQFSTGLSAIIQAVSFAALLGGL